jgi:hypothetical protein
MELKPPPWLALLLLSPAMGELLSGSAPPSEFFTPFGFVILVGLNGCGALVCRELKVRWRRGLGSLLLLGCAYGILEEGVMVASFFNPSWMDLGVLSGFGRWFEVNTVWAVELTIYHAIFSITIPVLLVELAYPEQKGGPWLGDRGFKIVSAALLLDVIVGFVLFGFMSGYWPPIPQYLLAILVMVLFMRYAKNLPNDWARVGEKPVKSPRYYLLLSFFSTIFSGLIFGVLPPLSDNALFPLVVMVVGTGFVTSVILYIRGFRWKNANRLQLMGVASGPAVFFSMIAFLQEMDQTRSDNPAGMSIVGLLTLIMLFLLWRKIKSGNPKIWTPKNQSNVAL